TEGAPVDYWPRARRTGGYTMVEILTLLVVLGIVTSLAAPRLDFQRYQIEGAMQAVGSTIMAAQRAAVQQQDNVDVAFDVANSRLRIHADANNDLVINGNEPVRFEPLGESVRFGRGGAPAFFALDQPVTFTLRQGAMPAVAFYRNGAASEEGGLYLTSPRALANPEYARDTRALRIDRSTGRPAWFRQESTLWKQEF